MRIDWDDPNWSGHVHAADNGSWVDDLPCDED